MKGIKIAVLLSSCALPLLLGFLVLVVVLVSGSETETGGGSKNDIAAVALNEVKEENNGGGKFWSYLGFAQKVPWCASFVSWCGNQCGYYNTDGSIMPKSALCDDFRTFYKNIGKWQDAQAHGGTYIPKRGDFIVFNWKGNPDAKLDHIGIVTKADGQNVKTVEGNSSDAVREKVYPLSSTSIIGYCVPDYPLGGITGSGGHTTDQTSYTQEELELIYACVQQEDGQTYDGALAVISTVMNRVESGAWSKCGRNALEQLKAPGQFCYSIDTNWKKWLGGNVNAHVKKAVDDCLQNGIRNHGYTSFRTKQGSHTGGAYIPEGGNYYF